VATSWALKSRPNLCGGALTDVTGRRALIAVAYYPHEQGSCDTLAAGKDLPAEKPRGFLPTDG
jgi:hypothetical protein